MFRAPTDKILVAITQEFVPLVADSAAFANSVVSRPELTFSPSDIRGATLVADQGDHATAYALYWESIRAEVASTIQGSENHVSPFTTKIYSKPSFDQQALQACGLYPDIGVLVRDMHDLSQDIYDLTQKPANIQTSQDLTICEENLKALKEILAQHKRKKLGDADLKKLQELEKKVNLLKIRLQLIQHFKNWNETFARLAENIEELKDFYQNKMDVLKEEYRQIDKIIKKRVLDSVDSDSLVQQGERKLVQIQEIRQEYFYKILQKLSEQYLLYQNQMPYVTFERIPEQPPVPGEGTRIGKALERLREIHDTQGGLTLTDTDYGTINQKLQDLLFFPKITPDNLKVLEVQKEKLLSNNRIQNWLQCLLIRDNRAEVLAYVIARHLQSFFDAFQRFSVHDFRQRIIQSFVDTTLAGWNLESQAELDCRLKITGLLDIYQSAFSEVDASLNSQISRSTPSRMSEDERKSSSSDKSLSPPQSKKQRTFLPGFEKSQADSAVSEVQAPSAPVQSSSDLTAQQQKPASPGH